MHPVVGSRHVIWLHAVYDFQREDPMKKIIDNTYIFDTLSDSENILANVTGWIPTNVNTACVDSKAPVGKNVCRTIDSWLTSKYWLSRYSFIIFHFTKNVQFCIDSKIKQGAHFDVEKSRSKFVLMLHTHFWIFCQHLAIECCGCNKLH